MSLLKIVCQECSKEVLTEQTTCVRESDGGYICDSCLDILRKGNDVY